jgi:hypothetical protein
MSQYKDYNSSTVHNAWCTYSTLGNYNGGAGAVAPVPQTTRSGFVVVPNYSAPGYDTLTKGSPGCGGFIDIQNAYGSCSQNCNTSYRTRLCSPENAPASSCGASNSCAPQRPVRTPCSASRPLFKGCPSSTRATRSWSR